jgi:hypothetical protein
MRGLFLFVLGVFLAVSSARADNIHASWDALLAKRLVVSSDGVNRVDYGGWKADAADRAALSGYVDALAATKVSALPREARFAHWANLYNALTVQVILDAYPVASIRDIRSKGAGLSVGALIGPWKTKLVTVEGRRLSLDDIEHAILRPEFKDPRVHYAVNCASIGCPNLKPTAWRAETLDADLDAAARAFVGHPRGVRLDAQGRLRLSSIYKWFAADFGADERQLIAHLAAYAPEPLKPRLTPTARVAGYGYDWSLNDAKGGR